jgi:hypothetical protein
VEKHKSFVRKHNRKKPLGRLRHKWENNIEMDLTKKQDGRVWTRIL